jgi:nicotinamide-nucleotide amidase
LSAADPGAATSGTEPDPLAAACLDALRAQSATVATAESLTAGLVCATIATVPGASDSLRGGLAAYAADVKTSVLGVDTAVIDRYGVVSAECAEAMAQCARRLFDADWAVATTGVAGPTEQDGRPVGTVFVAAAGPLAEAFVRGLILSGDRGRIRRDATSAALTLLLGELRGERAGN